MSKRLSVFGDLGPAASLPPPFANCYSTLPNLSFTPFAPFLLTQGVTHLTTGGGGLPSCSNGRGLLGHSTGASVAHIDHRAESLKADDSSESSRDSNRHGNDSKESSGSFLKDLEEAPSSSHSFFMKREDMIGGLDLRCTSSSAATTVAAATYNLHSNSTSAHGVPPVTQRIAPTSHHHQQQPAPLQSPHPIPSMPEIGLDFVSFSLSPSENVYECAAKLLFFSVKWARSIPSFLQLPFRDQAILLEEAWCELFVLSAAQWGLAIEDGIILAGNSIITVERQASLLEIARMLRETISRFESMRIDHTEYACLKGLVLFKPETSGLRDPLQVEILQDQTQLMLHEHCVSRMQQRSKVRFGKVLLLLPMVRAIDAHAIEEMFFRKTIGNIPIERLLCDMFKSS